MKGDTITDERRRERAELASIAVMSLATLVTAWCAAQAEAWSGMQIFRTAASNHLLRTSLAAQIEGNQIRMFDATQFSFYAAATGSRDEALSRFLHDRMRPEPRAAVDAWWTTRPLQNATAPATPMLMREYVVPQYARSAELAKAGEACQRDGQTANVLGLGRLHARDRRPRLRPAARRDGAEARLTHAAARGSLGERVALDCLRGLGRVKAHRVPFEVRRARLLSAECRDALDE